MGTDTFDATALHRFRAVGDAVRKRNLRSLPEKFQATVGEVEPSDKVDKVDKVDKSDRVRIMTLGISRGLTVNPAIKMGAQDGNIPDRRGAIAEKRRYLHVALTRATDLTVVTYADPPRRFERRKGQFEKRPQSPFMTDLDGVDVEDGADGLRRDRSGVFRTR